jgi:hypothetical protein
MLRTQNNFNRLENRDQLQKSLSALVIMVLKAAEDFRMLVPSDAMLFALI